MYIREWREDIVIEFEGFDERGERYLAAELPIKYSYL